MSKSWLSGPVESLVYVVRVLAFGATRREKQRVSIAGVGVEGIEHWYD